MAHVPPPRAHRRATASSSILRGFAGAVGFVLAAALAAAPGRAAATEFHVLHSFDDTHGYAPYGDIAIGPDGVLYGATSGGGIDERGVLFSYDVTTHQFRQLHRFKGGADGAYPNGGVAIDADGRVYGTTAEGGATNTGMVFRWDATTGYRRMADAVPGPNGHNLQGTLTVGPDGTVYGSAIQGGDGTCGCGTIWRLDAPAHALVAVHTFTGPDGAGPQGELVFDGTTMRGGTDDGGPFGQGALFTMNGDGSGFAQVFNNTSAREYASGQVRDAAGNWWGVSELGGDIFDCFCGSIYRVGPDGVTVVVHSFHGHDGANPTGTPVLGLDGNLYGTAGAGGLDDHGVVWKLDLTTFAFSVIHRFKGSDGDYPHSRLVRGPDGTLYGATTDQGRLGYGNLFSIVP